MTTETTATKPATFEFETCTRCGGTGHFSRCAMYGTTCFRCKGGKRTLTARGAAAKAFFEASCSKPAAEVAVGDAVWIKGFFDPSHWLVVKTIERDVFMGRSGVGAEPNIVWTAHYGTRFSGVDAKGEDEGTTVESGTTMRVRQNPEERAVKMAAALAYQATLTAKGTPRKRAARATAAA